MTSEQRKYLKGVPRCELCGSPKSLELHHIIPTVFGGPDVLDNWIAICSGCHAKLTPRSLLIKKGQAKFFSPVQDFYKLLADEYDEMERNQDYYCLSVSDVLDAFEKIFQNDKNPVKAVYIGCRYKED